MMYFAAPANDRLSFQQSDERWNNDIDCISQQNLPFLASTSSFGLACDRKTILSGRTVVPVPVWPTFFVKWEGRVLPASFSRPTSRRFFFLFFCWENIGDKIRKIILKSVKRRSNDPQFEGKGLATLLFVLVVLLLRCCFECLHSPRVPTLEKSPFAARGLLMSAQHCFVFVLGFQSWRVDRQADKSKLRSIEVKVRGPTLPATRSNHQVGYGDNHV